MTLRLDHHSEQLVLSPALSVTLKAGGTGEISGYASTFGGPPDAYGGVFVAGAFTKSLAEHKTERTTPVMLWAHQMDLPIGKWTELREDAKGLFVRGRINLSVAAGREAHTLLSSGDVSGLSIGGNTPPGSVSVNREGVVLRSAFNLMEISVVSIPANKRARVTEIRSLQSKTELVDLLRSAGIAKAAATRLAAGGWPALQNGDESRAIALAARIAEAATNLRKAK